MKSINFLIVALILMSLQSEVFAQCCAAGNPVSSNYSMQNSGINVLGVSYSHIYSISDTYYNGIEQLDSTYSETEFNFSSISLSYGLTDKLRILADIGYFFNKSQNFVKLDYNRYAQGFGNLNLGLSYDTYQSEDNEFKVSQTLKITLPVGEFNQVYDDIKLPIDLQPSSGNYKYNLGLMLSNRFGNSGFTLYSINSIETAQFVETSTSKYKYGNLYNLSLIGAYQILDELSGLLQLRFEIRDRALIGSKNQPNQYSYLNATGVVNVFVSPQLNYTIADDWTVSCQLNYPIYKNVNGEQLTNKFSLQAGISKSFDFFGDEEFSENPEIIPNGREEGLSFAKVKVSGECDMCKSRIENVANEFDNVEDSDWDSETDLLTIFYKDISPDITAILKSIADSGHDNEKYKADDTVYNKLPKCCQYRSN
ncbi:MAG: hypothetical protein RO257_12130 [Candidatus Kapabacteria bacterium]|nr:hypothetical protein [Candidatus Kapabacteria bacterium]